MQFDTVWCGNGYIKQISQHMLATFDDVDAQREQR